MPWSCAVQYLHRQDGYITGLDDPRGFLIIQASVRRNICPIESGAARASHLGRRSVSLATEYQLHCYYRGVAEDAVTDNALV